MANFDCYTRYLHEHQAAQSLHTKEYKVNQSYRSFLIKAKDHPDAKRKQLQDLLVEPVQRISRYTMLLKGTELRDFESRSRLAVFALRLC
jgi:hypothetical protein